MRATMNIYDVSKKAGVSIATVSRVLNGNSKVTDKTKQKVLKAMEELDYTPNIFARGLGLNTMRTIGIMCSDSSDTYLANAVYYLEQELRSRQKMEENGETYWIGHTKEYLRVKIKSQENLTNTILLCKVEGAELDGVLLCNVENL